MPQKKKKSHLKKHINQRNQNIIYQTIPNYSSSQITGHQYNKNKVQFAPEVQQESRTDNFVGDLIGKLMNKIDNDGNQQTQQYSKEIQPQNNNSNSGNNSTVNIYNDGTKNKIQTHFSHPQTQTQEKV